LEVFINPLVMPEEFAVKEIIRNAMADYEEGKVMTATNRRLENLFQTYQGKGSVMVVAKHGTELIGAAGIGPLHGLSLAEGLAEIRDLVVSSHYRRMGIGAKLIQACINFAKEQKYKTIYLETTPTMSGAQRLFKSFGFRAVVEQNSRGTAVEQEVPGYYILDNLILHKS